MKKLSICLISIVLLNLLACQEEEIPTQENVIKQKPTEFSQLSSDAYAEHHYKHMKTLAKGLLYKSQDPEFRRLLYKKVGERFDGEPKV